MIELVCYYVSIDMIIVLFWFDEEELFFGEYDWFGVWVEDDGGFVELIGELFWLGKRKCS